MSGNNSNVAMEADDCKLQDENDQESLRLAACKSVCQIRRMTHSVQMAMTHLALKFDLAQRQPSYCDLQIMVLAQIPNVATMSTLQRT